MRKNAVWFYIRLLAFILFGNHDGETVLRLAVVRAGHGAVRDAREVCRRRGARLDFHRRRQRHRLVANHLAWAQVQEFRINRAARRALGSLELNLPGLALVSDARIAVGLVVLAGAEARRARLAPQVVLEVYHVAFDLAYRGSADDAQFHAAFVAVFVLNGVQNVRKRTRALIQLLPVRARIVHQAIEAHDYILYPHIFSSVKWHGRTRAGRASAATPM